VLRRFLPLALGAVLSFACSEAQEAPAGEARAAGERAADPKRPAAKGEARRERPLPAFSGWTLENERLDIASLIGRRLLVFFFNPEVRDAEVVTRALGGISGLRASNNFQIVGIATGSDRDTALDFARRLGIDYPVIDDSSARLANQFGLRAPLAVIGVDAEGYVTFGLGQFATNDPKAVETIEASLREALRLPVAGAELQESAGSHPLAPTFRAAILDGEDRFDLAEQRGRPVVLIFFLHTCPHCHEALAFLKEVLAGLPAEGRPTLVGIEVTGRTQAVRQELRSRNLDFFPVLFDDGGHIRSDYSVFAGVPDTFLIDAEGRIVARVRGWTAERDEPLMKMRLAKMAGAPVPMLLRPRGYSGSAVCGVCHELEHDTWTFTSHSSAFDTLVRHGAEANRECVGCHVVGFGEPGGFTSSTETTDLEHVGCESCHGRGGPHLSPGLVTNGDYAETCVACHDAKHSLGFDYATFRPRISHAANAALVALPPEEKAKILASRGRPGGDLLPTRARYVGSDACRGCHAAEYESFAASGHARAVGTLAERGSAEDAACLACHTTGFGLAGGFPKDGRPDAHEDLARVGCESCHGPGGEHVAEGAQRIGTIVALGDKCDSCVVLQICGSCHDEANDPGFEFEVLDKIEALRHGTIEPGTGRPKEASASAAPSHEALLAGAIAAGSRRP
jgi:peroxiredoxin